MEATQTLAFYSSSGATLMPSASRCRGSAGDYCASPMGRRRGEARTVTMASSVAPPPGTKAEKKTEHFLLKEEGNVEFGSSQRVEVGRSERESRRWG